MEVELVQVDVRDFLAEGDGRRSRSTTARCPCRRARSCPAGSYVPVLPMPKTSMTRRQGQPRHLRRRDHQHSFHVAREDYLDAQSGALRRRPGRPPWPASTPTSRPWPSGRPRPRVEFLAESAEHRRTPACLRRRASASPAARRGPSGVRQEAVNRRSRREGVALDVRGPRRPLRVRFPCAATVDASDVEALDVGRTGPSRTRSSELQAA